MSAGKSDRKRREFFVVSHVAHVLNEALKLDPVGVNSLFSKTVNTVEAVADHKRFVVRASAGDKPPFKWSILGLLNGLSDYYVVVARMKEVCPPEIQEFTVGARTQAGYVEMTQAQKESAGQAP